MEPNRIGKCTEYKRGHYYLTHTEWPDGHCEIEIHECHPVLIYHSCDSKDLGEAKSLFAELVDREKISLPILDTLPQKVLATGRINET